MLRRFTTAGTAVALVVLLACCSLVPTACRTPTPPDMTEPSAQSPTSSEPAGEYVAITPVTVIDVAAGTARPNSTVVVRGDRIAAVGPATTTPVPAGAAVIDGRGKYLIPGLWDMHAHVVDPAMLPLFTRYGVTGVRQMFALSSGCAPRLGLDLPAGAAGPRVVGANQVLDGPDTRFPSMVRGNILTAATPDEARARVRELKDRGNGCVKVFSRLPRAAYLAAADEARLLGLPVVGHVPMEVTAAEASDAGQRTIEHLDQVAVGCSSLEGRLMAQLRLSAGPGSRPEDASGWRVALTAHRTHDPVKADRLFRKFAANGTWHVPTLVQTRSVARLADADAVDPALVPELPAAVRLAWRRVVADGGVMLPYAGLQYTRAALVERAELFGGEAETVRRMHAAGVPILAGTDTPNPDVFPGLSLHEELGLLVEAGLTPAEALRAATLDPARCLGHADRVGAVEPGKLADLVLLSADPLADIRNTRSVEAVLIGGRVQGRCADRPERGTGRGDLGASQSDRPSPATHRQTPTTRVQS